MSDANGTNPRYLAVPGTPTEPAWAPDGRRLVYTAGSSGLCDVYVVDIDGTDPRLVVRNGCEAGWSTRGWIAFTREQQIYRVRPDGTGLRRLTRRGGSAPSWSPHGTRLAFQRRMLNRRGKAVFQVFTMRANGTRLRRVTRREGGLSPAWSPDGRWVAFLRPRLDILSTQLYRVRTDGTDVRRVGPKDPDWQPRP